MSQLDKVYKYDTSVSILYTKDLKQSKDSFELDKRNIIGLSVAKDFKNNILPVVNLKISLSEKDYYFILDNKNHVKILLKIYAYLVDDKTSLEDYLSKKIPYMKNKIMDIVFRPYFDDVTPYTEKDINEDKDSLQNERSDFRILNMYLYSEDNLEKNKIDINFSLNNCSPFDALIYACNKTNVKDLIIKEPDNLENYRQIICPPLKLKQSIEFIQNNYGIYKQGLLFFQDFNRTYILPKYLNKSVIEKDECNIIYFFINNKKGNNINMSLNSYYDKRENMYVINTLNNVTINDNSNLNKELIGDRVNLIDINSEEKIENINLELDAYESSNEITKNKNLILYNNNPYKIEEFKSKINNEQISLSLSVINIDVSFLTPNKQIIFLFEDTATQNKFGGHYSLSYLDYSIYRESGGSLDMQIKCNLILNKIMYI